MELILQIALTFFLVANPIGNSPVIITLVKDFPFKRQKIIMLREGFFALLLALFFQYAGEHFLNLLNISNYAVTLCGGMILFLISLQMIFSISENQDTVALKQEPFIVPIATPLLTGAGLLSVVMLKSHEVQNDLIITSALLVAWVGVLGVLALAPYLQRILGKSGLLALEQLMGLVLAMISVQMLVRGIGLFLEVLKR
jgi:multiple antibiotic resistance protein